MYLQKIRGNILNEGMRNTIDSLAIAQEDGIGSIVRVTHNPNDHVIISILCRQDWPHLLSNRPDTCRVNLILDV
jgi:hypothetical protein